MFESCFQLIIQFIAVFEFESVEQDIYLFASICISVLVILSKLMLMAYNLRRKLMWFNIYCYFMDILFSLMVAWMVSSVVVHDIHSITGIYLVIEFIIAIPFYCYYIAHTTLHGFSKSYLTVPILLLIWHQIALFSFATFSTYPAIIYIKTNPIEIGQKEQFFKSLYKYCNSSQSQHEFDTKLIIINYLCLKQFQNSNVNTGVFYQFEQWLLSFAESDLCNISIEQFHQQTKFDNASHVNILHPEHYNLSLLLKVKSLQIIIRVIFIISS
eukprot:479899_1